MLQLTARGLVDLDVIQDLPATPAAAAAEAEAPHVSPVEELELNNYVELTVGGLRTFVFTATTSRRQSAPPSLPTHQSSEK
jgi:hypothetical protein